MLLSSIQYIHFFQHSIHVRWLTPLLFAKASAKKSLHKLNMTGKVNYWSTVLQCTSRSRNRKSLLAATTREPPFCLGTAIKNRVYKMHVHTLYFSCSHVSYPPFFLLQMPARLSIINHFALP